MDAVRGFLHDWRLVLLIIHVGVTAAMIVVILLQRSEGGGLGMGRTDALFSVRSPPRRPARNNHRGRPFLPPKILRRGNIPMAAANKL